MRGCSSFWGPRENSRLPLLCLLAGCSIWSLEDEQVRGGVQGVEQESDDLMRVRIRRSCHSMNFAGGALPCFSLSPTRIGIGRLGVDVPSSVASSHSSAHTFRSRFGMLDKLYLALAWGFGQAVCHAVRRFGERGVGRGVVRSSDAVCGTSLVPCRERESLSYLI